MKKLDHFQKFFWYMFFSKKFKIYRKFIENDEYVNISLFYQLNDILDEKLQLIVIYQI
jgi:hypothetical protein